MKLVSLMVLLLLTPGRAEDEMPLALEVLREQRNQRVKAINDGYLARLERLKAAYLKKGELDGAALAAKWLKEWKEEAALRSKAGSESGKLPETKEQLRTYLKGTRWDRDDQKGMTFGEDGTFSNATVTCTYVVTGANTVTIQWGTDTVIPCQFSEDFSEMVEQTELRKTFRRAEDSP